GRVAHRALHALTNCLSNCRLEASSALMSHGYSASWPRRRAAGNAVGRWASSIRRLARLGHACFGLPVTLLRDTAAGTRVAGKVRPRRGWWTVALLTDLRLFSKSVFLEVGSSRRTGWILGDVTFCGLVRARVCAS